jgi:REP element-mobilizing transposase RayT
VQFTLSLLLVVNGCRSLRRPLYGYFDRWFEYLSKSDAYLLVYVIMPNHFHGLIYLTDKCNSSLNLLVGNGKRFLAYEIVKRLKESAQEDVLKHLSARVREKEKAKRKQREVFRLSFDAKKCFNRAMVEQKLDYIHRNPVSGKWNLAEDWRNHEYSRFLWVG